MSGCVIKGPFDERRRRCPSAFSRRPSATGSTAFRRRFPTRISRAFFLLSEADQTAINHQREAHTRLGFALQLCALRYLGFAPDDLSTAPWEAVVYVAQQLGVLA